MRYFFTLFLLPIVLSWAGEPELPLCPTNIQFLPQNLPMHCRMPTNADGIYPKFPEPPQIPTAPPFAPPFYQSPPPDGQPPPIPIPVPGLPPFPGGMMPPMMPPPMMPPPMMPPHPGPMHKLPVIVMPFYSPDPAYKTLKPEKTQQKKKVGIGERRHHKFYRDYSSDTDHSSDTTDTDTTSTSSDTSRERWGHKGIGRSKNSRRFLKKRRSRKNKQRKSEKEFLTPILQYVTNDGYVIFEKKISKGEAKDWLGEKKLDKNEIEDLNKENQKDLSSEEHARNRGRSSNPAAAVQKLKKPQKPLSAPSKPRPPK